MKIARQLITNAGQRPTLIRAAVLSALLDADDALSHAELLERLLPHGEFDRVTVYRALDWLVTQGLAHKVAGAGRAWRFRSSLNETTSASLKSDWIFNSHCSPAAAQSSMRDDCLNVVIDTNRMKPTNRLFFMAKSGAKVLKVLC